MVEPLTPDRRRALTRSHLLEAAAQVFARQGFHGASIDDVARAAGFTKGAVYSNFKNKEDLFLALMDRRSQEQLSVVGNAMTEASSLTDDERASRFRDLTAGLLWGDRDWQLLVLEFSLYAARNAHAAQRLVEQERREREQLIPLIRGELDRVGTVSPVPLDDLASIFLALFRGIALQHVIDPEGADDTLLESAMEFLHDRVDTFPKGNAST
jgi:AcrR family transcriptional regulator